MRNNEKRLDVKSDQNRLHNLDYLRGLAAFGIMIYHYLSWSSGKFSAETFMGRFGVYGVSIFYVLSGLTLFYVYYNKMQLNIQDVVVFFRKRVFRIFPLLWLVTILAILLSRKVPDFTNLFLNLSGFFGFIRWDKYFSAGVWSIGNELVFYVFFPFFVFFLKKFKPIMILLTFVLLSLYLYFAFVILNPEQPIREQWRDYINPLNQVFLFLGGFLIGVFLQNVKMKDSIVVLLVIVGLIAFTFIPSDEDAITIVTGVNRLLFTTCCFLICICFYKLTFQFPKFIHKPLTLLGETSYSVYLLHPIVWTLSGITSKIFSKYIFVVSQSVRLFLSVVLSLIVSYYVYQYFEKYFMKFGRTNKQNVSK